MKNVLIRDLNDSLVDSFKAEARRRGTSLQFVLKEVLQDHSPKVPSEAFWQRLEKARKETGPATEIARLLIQGGRDGLDEKTNGTVL